MLDSKLISKMVAEIGIELDLTEDELDFTFSNPYSVKGFIKTTKLKYKEQVEANQTVIQNFEKIETVVSEHEASKTNITTEELASVYEKLKNRELHPTGKFDSKGRFYLEDKELVDVKEPSSKHPFSQMNAGRTAKFVKAIAEKYRVQNLVELESLFTVAKEKS